jgi:cell division septal protein FtsQ
MSTLRSKILAQRRSRRKKRAQKRLILATLFFIVVLLAGAWFFLSDRFQIERVTVSGSNLTDEEAVLTFVRSHISNNFAFVIPKSNIWFLGSSALAEGLASTFPAIKSARPVRVFPAGLHLDVEEHKPIATVCDPDIKICYLLDTRGYAFAKSQAGLENYPILHDEERKEFTLDEKVFDENIILMAKYFQDKFATGTIDVYVSRTDDTVTITTPSGWYILALKDADLEEIYENLRAALEGEIKDRISDLEYIDLRLGNRIFYKFVGE